MSIIMDTGYIHIVPILAILIMLPIVTAFAYGESNDMRKDMYKNMSIEVTRLVLFMYFINTKIDILDMTTKIAGMLVGLLLYHTVLYPAVYGTESKNDSK